MRQYNYYSGSVPFIAKSLNSLIHIGGRLLAGIFNN